MELLELVPIFNLIIVLTNIQYMKLTENVIALIGDTKVREAKAIRTKLALALNFTERWVFKCIHDNKDNGPLTTVKSVRIIQEETGLDQSQILEETEKGELAARV